MTPLTYKDLAKDFDEKFTYIRKLKGGDRIELLASIDEIKSFLRASLLKAFAAVRVEKRIAEYTQEEKELLIQIFGTTTTPQYMQERIHGYNTALKEIDSNITRFMEER